jgi:SAM-dependent methyltransferase
MCLRLERKTFFFMDGDQVHIIGETTVYHDGYLENSNSVRNIAPVIERYLATQPQLTGRMLDLGCGDGAVLKRLRQTFGQRFSYVGIDAFSNPDESLPNAIQFHQRDLNADFNLDDLSCDVLISCEVIEHIVETDHFMVQAAQLLAPGGILIMTTPNLASFFNRILLLFGYQPLHSEVSWQNPYLGREGIYDTLKIPKLPAAGHLRVFTYKALEAFIRFHGFTIEARLAFSPYDGLLGKISRLFSFCPSLMPGICLVARKTKNSV